MLVSSVPLSETQLSGLPRRAMRASSSRATRWPDSDVSATRHRHSRSCDTPAAGSPHARCKGGPRLPAWLRASPFFCRDVLQHGVVQHRLGQQLLQPTVLVLQRPQPLGLRHFQTAVLRFPLVERRTADPMLAADVRRRRTSLMLPQNTDDLLFREPSLLHPPSPFEDGLYLKLEEFQ